MVVLPAGPHDDPKLVIEDRALRLLTPLQTFLVYLPLACPMLAAAEYAKINQRQFLLLKLYVPSCLACHGGPISFH